MIGFIFRVLVAPRSKEKDRARREFILNILLASLVALSTAAFFINVFYFVLQQRTSGENPAITGIISSIFIISYILSRKGKSYASAVVLVSILLIVAVYLNYRYGADQPVNLLLFALIIVMSGILIDTKFAFLTTIFTSFSVIIFSYMEISGIINPNRVREIEGIRMADSLVYAIILVIISLVSWLFNRESEKTLRRARNSEEALKRQRDKLEILVDVRTKQLRIAREEKIAQLYKFAQFGRISSGLFHDLATPLNVISLNLGQLRRQRVDASKEEISEMNQILKRAISGTNRLEKFVYAARKQIQSQEVLQTFSLEKVIKEAIELCQNTAKKSGLTIAFKSDGKYRTYGNHIKLSQVITNLITNAIDSYENTRKQEKKVEIRLEKIDNIFKIEVQDWGSGIAESDLIKIFDDFYTTKTPEKGLGIGLSISRDIIEKDFRGKCIVKSKKGQGTTFKVELPVRKKTSI